MKWLVWNPMLGISGQWKLTGQMLQPTNNGWDISGKHCDNAWVFSHCAVLFQADETSFGDISLNGVAPWKFHFIFGHGVLLLSVRISRATHGCVIFETVPAPRMREVHSGVARDQKIGGKILRCNTLMQDLTPLRRAKTVVCPLLPWAEKSAAFWRPHRTIC